MKWEPVLAGDVPFLKVEKATEGGDLEGRWPKSLTSSNPCIFPGSFNPLHDGHLEIASVAEDRLQTSVWFELSLLNIEKGELSPTEIEARVGQSFSHHELIVTKASTFVQKSRLFPDSWFLVGVDTILRVDSDAFYESANHRKSAIREIGERGCRFLVFGRLHGGRFQEFFDLKVSVEMAALCESVSESDFRNDVSSTGLR